MAESNGARLERLKNEVVSSQTVYSEFSVMDMQWLLARADMAEKLERYLEAAHDVERIF